MLSHIQIQVQNMNHAMNLKNNNEIILMERKSCRENSDFSQMINVKS